jgi:hypothetical protein
MRLLAAALVLTGCGGDGALPAAEPTAPLELIDPAIPPAIAGEDGWNHHLSAEIDLNGDGVPERVVLTARVELHRGRPAWDDGQPWQVYVASADGERRYVYAQRLQLGTLTLRVAEGGDGGRPSVVLIEHLPDRMRVLETFQPEGSAQPTTFLRFERRLDPRGELASPRLP